MKLFSFVFAAKIHQLVSNNTCTFEVLLSRFELYLCLKSEFVERVARCAGQQQDTVRTCNSCETLKSCGI